MRRPEVREWRARLVAWANGDAPEPTTATMFPTTALGDWLRAGPNTMGRAEHRRLSGLRGYHQARTSPWPSVQKIARSLGREGFAALWLRDVGLFLRVSYPPEALEPLLYRNNPFLGLIRKGAA